MNGQDNLGEGILAIHGRGWKIWKLEGGGAGVAAMSATEEISFSPGPDKSPQLLAVSSQAQPAAPDKADGRQAVPLLVFPHEDERFANAQDGIRGEEGLSPGAGASLPALPSECTDFSPACRVSVASASARFGQMFLCFAAAALVGALPRVLVLAGLRAADSVDLTPSTLDLFPTLWRACDADNEAYTGYSKHGVLYKLFISSDHALAGVGMILGMLAALRAAFQSLSSRAGRIMFFGFVFVFLAVLAVSQGVSIQYLSSGEARTPFLVAFFWSSTPQVLIGLLAIALLLVSAHARFGSSMVFGNLTNKLKIVCVSAVILFYCRWLMTLMGILPPGNVLLTVVVIQTLSQLLLFILRALISIDSTTPQAPFLMLKLVLVLMC